MAFISEKEKAPILLRSSLVNNNVTEINGAQAG